MDVMLADMLVCRHASYIAQTSIESFPYLRVLSNVHGIRQTLNEKYRVFQTVYTA